MNTKKQYKRLKMIIKQNDKIIKKGKKFFNQWKHNYTIEEYKNAVAYSYNPKIKDLEIFL